MLRAIFTVRLLDDGNNRYLPALSNERQKSPIEKRKRKGFHFSRFERRKRNFLNDSPLSRRERERDFIFSRFERRTRNSPCQAFYTLKALLCKDFKHTSQSQYQIYKAKMEMLSY